ncbi:hypothetical protein [Qipengyuania sp. JC766]|uniref:hypothetical protein n=1 Tax=Qipengyuania sp. JC766 TaxID=3232139 RepID=UPI0034588382
MRFFKRLNPVPGLKDFWTEFRRPQPYRVPILLVSCLFTGTIIWMGIPKGGMAPAEEPDVIYITTFSPDRSLEEIRQSNLANQERKEAREAALAAREERIKGLYRALGRATGVDVDEMEREIAREEAAQAAEEAALREELMQNIPAPSATGSRATGSAPAE